MLSALLIPEIAVIRVLEIGISFGKVKSTLAPLGLKSLVLKFKRKKVFEFIIGLLKDDDIEVTSFGIEHDTVKGFVN